MSNEGVDGKFCRVAGWGLGRSMAVTHVSLRYEVANHFCGFYHRYFIALHGIACYWVVGFDAQAVSCILNDKKIKFNI